MVYTFVLRGAVAMGVENVYAQVRRISMRMHEKGGRVNELPYHHNLDKYGHSYLSINGFAEDRTAFLFRTGRGQAAVDAADNPG